MQLPTLSPHPGVYLAGRPALAEYLKARGVDYSVQPLGFTLNLDIGAIVDYVIDVHWLDDQVRFFAPSAVFVAVPRLPEAALLVEELNARIGFPVWRLLPNLSATYTATLDHKGLLSSRVLEYAVALLRDALVRDLPVFRARLEGEAS
ncbi:MAG: hypothetical protein SFX73_06795 [Kofleriaceae bacterium]|nr:hypothetical protein [Kofleriaceae bacterium]